MIEKLSPTLDVEGVVEEIIGYEDRFHQKPLDEQKSWQPERRYWLRTTLATLLNQAEEREKLMFKKGWDDGYGEAEEEKRPDEPTRWVSEPMTQKEAEIYVQGMYDLMMMVGCDGHCKHYDPLFFEGRIAHSYVLELDDGGRHHSYITPQWVALKALLEFAQTLKDECDIAGWNEYFAENTLKAIKEIESSRFGKPAPTITSDKTADND